MESEQFIKKLQVHDIDLSELQIKQFETYRRLLQEYNKIMNLTAIIDTEDIYIKHFYDSIIPATFIDLKGSLLDVGAGAGFPSIPLKIVYPDLDVTILEPISKRVRFLTTLCQELGITVDVVESRAEDYIKETKKRYDFVSARAVANLQILSELCIPFVKVNGYFIALKGRKYEEELAASKNALKLLNANVEAVYTTSLEDADRAIIVIKKEKETDKKYPRHYGQIKKRPL